MAWLRDAIGELFSTDGFVPRRICGYWPDWLVWEHVLGNALIWLAYMAIPLMIWRLVRRRPQLAHFRGTVPSFVAFVGLCGLGHFLDMLAFFHPMYRFSGLVLVATGLASWWMAWTIRRAWPAILAMKNPAELERVIYERTGALALANRALVNGEERLRQLNENLEGLVRERTTKLGQLVRLVDQAHDAFIVRSQEGVISSWNQGAERIYGWTSAEVLGTTSHVLLKTRFPRPLREIKELLASTGCWDGELIHQRADGGVIVVRSRWVLDLDGSEAGAVLEINSDITEQRASEEALRRSEVTLKESQRLAKLGSWEWDPAVDAVTWSDELYLIAGRDTSHPAPSVAEHDELFAPESVKILGAALERTVQAGEPYEVELEMIRGDGSRCWIIARGEAMRDAGGRVVRLRGTVQDVSERRAQRDELRRAFDQAVAATRAKADFLANMSHEIRTPMNGVIGMTELLLDTPLDDVQRGHAETIRTSGEALLTVINDILDLSKIEAGKLTIESTQFDLRTLIEEVVDLLAPRALQKGISLCGRVAPEVPGRLVGDPVRIRQVLTNLVGNAVKFTDRGRVDVEASLPAGMDDPATLRVVVRDTGIGIPENRQGDIFESFTQVDGGSNRSFGGTGLGLAICRNLVELMGGRIGLESRLGQGSAFWFEIKLGTPGADLDPPGGGTAGLRVLVVARDVPERSALVEALRSWDCRPELAGSGTEAVSRVMASHLDDAGGGGPIALVLIDQDMPGMGCEQAARAIKAIPRQSRVPLVLLRSAGAPGGPERLDPDLWADGLARPVRRSKLHEILVRATSPPAPTQDQAQAQPAAPGVDGAEGRPPVRILLAEDNATNRMVLGGMAKRLGCSLHSVVNGQEAVEAVEQGEFDIVLMDVQMSEMDGFQATAEIRRRERERGAGRRIPIVALTAHAMQGDRERCLASGMDDYLTKPIMYGPLRDALRDWAGRVDPASTERRVDREAASPA